VEQTSTFSGMACDAAVTVVELHGEVDLDAAELLRDCLTDGVERNTDVLVDLADVTLIDCASLGVLVEARQLADRRGHRVCLIGPSPPVRRTLAATMLDSAFPLYPDRQRAMGDRAVGHFVQR
jgi:anti-anti-sigma factor